jgi:hypothetical protein
MSQNAGLRRRGFRVEVSYIEVPKVRGDVAVTTLKEPSYE